MNVWKVIEKQKEDAIKSDKEYKKFLEETLDEPFREYFQASWKNKIPLEYHTEAVGKPVYHPLTISRVLLYFNPNRLRENTLKKESLEWFGMSIDSLKKYVENGWIIVQLNTAETYSDRARQEIEDFFKNLEAKPIYVNIVDDLLPSVLGHDNKTLKDFLNEKEKEIKELYKKWCNIFKKPIKVHGAIIGPDKVKENYIKLEFLRDVFENKGDQGTVDAINVELKHLEEAKDRKELAQRAYTAFLIYGTPILYCDGSGYVSVGLEPYWNIVQANTKTMFGKIKVKAKRVLSSIKDEKTLYFPYEEQPREIIESHFKCIKQGNVNKARELEKKIIEMVDDVYHTAYRRKSYIKAFESYENEAAGAKLGKITVPLSIGTALIGYVFGGIIGTFIGLTPLLTELEHIRTIALKYVTGNRILGVEISEEELPDLRIKIPKAYKDFRFRTLKIPVENVDPTSGEMTITELRE